MELYGNPLGHSAMASSTGLAYSVVTQLVLAGTLGTGVLAPYAKEIYDRLRSTLENEGFSVVEQVL